MTNTINTTTYTINRCRMDTALFTGVDHLVDSGAGIALSVDTNSWAEVLRASGIAGPTLVYNGSRWVEVRRASSPGILLNNESSPGIALKWGVDICRSQSQVYDSEMPSITTQLCGA